MNLAGHRDRRLSENISSPGKIPRVLLVLLFLSLVLIYVNLSFFSKNLKMNLSLLVTFVETVKKEALSFFVFCCCCCCLVCFFFFMLFF